ncbi:MAG: YbaB/EbfC family nucleoid-associated protein [Caulobacteraceae bacterium]
MKDLGAIMKQAQEMQSKLQAAQEKLAQTVIEGSSGGGMVRLTLKGTGEMQGVTIDESLMAPGEGEVVSDLIVAAHADAKRKLDAKLEELKRDMLGPLAGMPGLPF